MEMPHWPHYDSPYWSPESNQNYNVIMEYEKEELKSFDDGKTQKWVLLFKVFQIGNEALSPPKQFVTGSGGFARQIRPIMEKASAEGKKEVQVFLTYNKKSKEYNVIDQSVVENAMRKK